MKWIYLTTAITLCSAGVSHVAFSEDNAKSQESQKPPSTTGTQVDPNKIVGKVGGQSIRLLDVMERIQALPSQQRQISLEQLFPNVLQQMALRMAAVNKAREKGLDKSAEFKKAHHEVGLNLLQELYLLGNMKGNFSEDDLKKEYEAYLKEFVAEDQVRARHILVKEEKEAQDLIAQLKKGEDFGTLAQQKSLDAGTARVGGDLDFFGKNDLVPEFVKAAFDLKDGELSEKPVKTSFGFHVIRREGSRKKEIVPFETAKSTLLPNRIRQREIQARMKEAVEGTPIELFNIDGSPLQLNASGSAQKIAPPPSSAASTSADKALPETATQTDSSASKSKGAGGLLKKWMGF